MLPCNETCPRWKWPPDDNCRGGDDHGDGAVDHGADGDCLGVVEDQLYEYLLKCALQSAFVIVALH